MISRDGVIGLLVIFLLAACSGTKSSTKAENVQNSRAYWPGIDGREWEPVERAAKERLRATPACQAFDRLMFPPENADAETAKKKGVTEKELDDKLRALKTDGVMVIRDGKVLKEKYIEPYKSTPTKLHPIWSASKSFTAALAGANAEQNPKFTLATKIKEVLTPAEVAALNSHPDFAEITVEELLAMAPNLDWAERYNDDLRNSSIANMLWVKGYKNMAAYAANQKFGKEGKGKKFIYSSGNAVLLFRMLQSMYPKAVYDDLPWKLLFDRLGMKKVVFEQDQSGNFIGSSYIHTSLRDFAKLGFLYLNNGFYGQKEGDKVVVKRVLHPDFMKKTRELSIGMASLGTTEEDIIKEESFYSLGFWVNLDPNLLKGVRDFKTITRKFIPDAPSNMIFAAGHYGQFLIMLPSQDLLIVRQGYDKEYFSKLNDIVKGALACYVPDDKGEKQ